MALTRTALEKTLLSRARKRMEFVGMSLSSNGDNPDLNDPIATALQRTGITPAEITDIQDSDLATVENVLQLIDLAELRLLENILGNADMVDITVGDRSERLSQFTTALEKAIEHKTAKVEKEYGLGLMELGAGVIDLDFQAKDDDVTYLIDLDIREGDILTVEGRDYPVKRVEAFKTEDFSKASFARLAKSSAALSRNISSGGGNYVKTVLVESMPCMPLDPIWWREKDEYRQVLNTPISLLKTYVATPNGFYKLLLEDLKK